MAWQELSRLRLKPPDRKYFPRKLPPYINTMLNSDNYLGVETTTQPLVEDLKRKFDRIAEGVKTTRVDVKGKCSM